MDEKEPESHPPEVEDFKTWLRRHRVRITLAFGVAALVIWLLSWADRHKWVNIDDLKFWIKDSGLEIVLIILGAVLLTRLVKWAANRFILIDVKNTAVGAAATEQSKHKPILVQVITWVSTVLIYFVAGLMVLNKLNLPINSIVAPATLLGAALGFGSQRIVQDLLSGFFIFAERQYGYGDYVQVSQPGEEKGISGTVEEVTLRTTKLRMVDGSLVILPNGEIRQVTNMSKDWGQVIIDVPLPNDADLSQSSEILHRISTEMYDDEQWRPKLLAAPTVMGIEKLSVGFLQLRFVARTLPGEQWNVGRELRGRIAESFRDAGIVVQPSFATPSTGGEP